MSNKHHKQEQEVKLYTQQDFDIALLNQRVSDHFVSVTELRAENENFRREMRHDSENFIKKMQQENLDFKIEMKTEMREFKQEVKSSLARVTTQLSGLYLVIIAAALAMFFK